MFSLAKLSTKKERVAQTSLKLKGETVNKLTRIYKSIESITQKLTKKLGGKTKKRAGCSDHTRVERRNSEEALTHLNI